MATDSTQRFTRAELEQQHAAELPSRDLMLAVSVLGIPLVGVSDVAVNVNTAGPNWLLGSIGSL